MSAVHERHGVVQSDDKALTVDEREGCLKLTANDGFGARFVFITPNEARHIATKLRRVARRIDERIGA